MILTHLGASGLGLRLGGARLLLDPPTAPDAPTVLTWTETERIAGVRSGPAPVVGASPTVLAWLGLTGVALQVDPVDVDGWSVRALPYPPIPYATPREGVRKMLSAIRSPLQASSRLRHLVRRPVTPPLALSLARDGCVIVVLGQALHRFTPEADLERLVQAFRGADVLVAGTDYDDEEATGRLAGLFGARTVVIADLTGPVRRMLHLPTRPLHTVLATAPAGTLLLEEGGELALPGYALRTSSSVRGNVVSGI